MKVLVLEKLISELYALKFILGRLMLSTAPPASVLQVVFMGPYTVLEIIYGARNQTSAEHA